ncbi:uncharacterized protein LOC128274177 [Anopheles cruzii]|uniref:uncharacterized protein LOC128274177 n=1 Tax=Anopheles cruzii TaxID=68878 RepID=UPI0022EC80D9|nr:uncharacterized protein LOC128274177 [Anopheles cruzii]
MTSEATGEGEPVRQFELSAPGKLILHGEHSVVYGHPAIAGPIGLRTHLRYEATGHSNDTVVFAFDSLPFTTSLSVGAFDEFLRVVDCAQQLQPDQLLQQMRTDDGFPFARFVQTQPSTVKERFSVAAALYIVNRVLRSEGVTDFAGTGRAGFRLALRSTMSIGAGLGSSASYGVCLAAGAYVLSRILKGTLTQAAIGHGFTLQQSPELLAKISGWAFDSEIIMHEKPSGIDNMVCTYGQLIRFRRGDSEHRNIRLRVPLHVLIVDSGVSRSTAQLVATAAKRRSLFPRTVGRILDAMGELVEEVIELLETPTGTDDDDGGVSDYTRLRTIVNINNNLLRSLGVSHPALERIFQLAERHGFDCKLTGAGGGGCAFMPLPANYEQLQTFHELVRELTEAGYGSIPTTIGGGTGVELNACPRQAEQ